MPALLEELGIDNTERKADEEPETEPDSAATAGKTTHGKDRLELKLTGSPTGGRRTSTYWTAAQAKAISAAAPLLLLPSALSFRCGPRLAVEAAGASKVVVGRRLNVPSSEKDIYDGSYKGSPCVLCFAKYMTATLEREARVLRRLAGCPHVIKLLEYIEGPQHCMVLERVEPLGHDFIEVVTQQTNSGRPMPLGQVRCYMLQLASACQEMGMLGVVHRDLKPDNVLVDRGHVVKVIDFGLAAVHDGRGTWLEAPQEVNNLYSAPEVNDQPSSPTIDLWSLGMILYTLCVGMNPTTQQILKWTCSSAGIRGALDGVHPGAIEAIEGLLQERPQDRWGLSDLRRWAAQQDVPETLPPSGGALQRWPYRDLCPQAFGAQLPEGWERSGETIGTLDLMRIGGVQVLLVDRYSEWHKFYTFDSEQRVTTAYRNQITNATQWDAPAGGVEEPIATPVASTVLRERDWIYFGVNSSHLSTTALRSVINERLGLAEADGDLGSLARRPSRSSLIQFLPEFIYFKFPEHCANAVLGQDEHAKPGQNALSLRKDFRINVAGVVRSDNTVSWWPGASEAGGGLIGVGDGALILRVPQWDPRSPILPSVKAEDIGDLMDVARFRRRLGLEAEEASWCRWRRNAGMRTGTCCLSCRTCS